jgi:signal peptidase I
MVTGSMSPTIQAAEYGPADWVVTEKISYWFRSPRRYEIVRFRGEEGLPVMKRVVGFPGEVLSVRDKRLLVDGRVPEAPASTRHLEYYPYGHLRGGKGHRCEDGYFVLGDDSRDSWDSRYIGSIPRERITGRAWFVVWPPNRIRSLVPR